MTKLFTVAAKYRNLLRKNALGYGDAPRSGDPKSKWDQYFSMLYKTALSSLNFVYNEQYSDLEDHGVKLTMEKYPNSDNYYYVLTTSGVVAPLLEAVGLGEVLRRAHEALKPWIVGDVKLVVRS